MLTFNPRRPRLASFLAILGFGLVLSASPAIFAGEIKFGAEPLAVGPEGKLTDAGRKAAKDELPSEPGEETWPVHLWAKLDKGAPGPLTVEFYGKLPDGKSYLVHRHIHDGYDGGSYVSLEFDVHGDDGFNKGYDYRVEITQLDGKGREFKLASGKVSLGWTPAPAEPEGEADKPDAEAENAAQDAIDSFGNDGRSVEGGPPPVEPKKQGCSAHPATPSGWGLVALMGLGVVRRRRANEWTAR